MPVTLILPTTPPPPLKEGAQRPTIRDRRFEALYVKSFEEMRARSTTKH